MALPPKIILDPDTDESLKLKAYERIRAASNGTLTDFSPGSPIAALVEGQVFAIAELLWFLNMLPEALAVEQLRLSGVERSIGTKATGSVYVLLNTPLATPFFIPAGYTLRYKEVGYVTTADLTIPAGSLEATVPIEAITEGKAYNAPALAINITNGTGLSFVSAIYNDEPITGGSDMETLEQYILRAQTALRQRRTLVTKDDFESKVQELLGFGSKAKCYPLLAADKLSKLSGNAHVFAVTAEGRQPSTATLQSVQQQVSDLAFVSASIWVSAPDFLPTDIEVVATVEALTERTAKAIFKSMREYLSPTNWDFGATVQVKEVEYVVRSTTDVVSVQSVLLNGQATNLGMPNVYTTPKLGVATVSLVNRLGLTQTWYISDDSDIDFD